MSVRGDREFRTTVSRAGLEHDERYHQMANLCSKMLFEHVSDEVARIASKAGQPLSQASSAARWLYDDLSRACASKSASEQLARLYDASPNMVLESVRRTADEVHTGRELISRTDLQVHENFWTVESRLVDSLGTISRDLGRELSLNEFLVALAPDFAALRYSPILADAHTLREGFSTSYACDRVEFSREHQQAAVRWAKGTASERIDLRMECGPVLMPRVQDSYNTISRPHLSAGIEELSKVPITDSVNVGVAEIIGDDAAVDVVVTRLGLFFKAGSNVARLWGGIRRTILTLAEQDEDYESLIKVFNAAASLESCWGNSRSGSLRDKLDLYYGDVSGKVWRECVDCLRKTTKADGLHDWPDDLSTLVKNVTVFNATSYWRDWFRVNRN